jgi:3-oxoadipate enol-lactonase
MVYTDAGFAEVNGARVYYEIAGSGPPLVFIHGFSLDTRMWDDQFEHFAGRYRVLRYDLRGFGKSSLPTEAPFSNHDDLRALLDHVRIDRAHVCGLSSGGGITIDFALEHAGRVRSAVLISSALGGHQGGVGSMGPSMMAMSKAAKAGDLVSAKRIWVDSPLFAPARLNPAVAARLRDMVETWSGWQLTNHANTIDPDPLPVDRVADLVAPTLVIVGEQDNEVVQEIAVQIEAEAPNARRVVVPDAGHMTNMEAPEAVNSHIAAFLAAAEDA